MVSCPERNALSPVCSSAVVGFIRRTVGESVVSVGSELGNLEGIIVGKKEGTNVGVVGSTVGLVGVLVGDNVGGVGNSVGCGIVGEFVGIDGSLVGIPVGI